MRKLFALAAVIAAAFALTSVPALAASGHTVSMTQTTHGQFLEPNATNPITGDPILVHFDGNAVSHITFFTASDEAWATFTETGSVWFTDQGVTYSGRATAWGNFNFNQRNSNSTFTLTIHVTGTNGTSVWGHEVTHITYNGNGQVTVTFDKMTFTS